jgi:hypothetical protein
VEEQWKDCFHSVEGLRNQRERKNRRRGEGRKRRGEQSQDIKPPPTQSGREEHPPP